VDRRPDVRCMTKESILEPPCEATRSSARNSFAPVIELPISTRPYSLAARSGMKQNGLAVAVVLINLDRTLAVASGELILAEASVPLDIENRWASSLYLAQKANAAATDC
jgi:hypothetical protein